VLLRTPPFVKVAIRLPTAIIRVAEVVLPLAGVSLRRHHDSLVERPAVPTQ